MKTDKIFFDYLPIISSQVICNSFGEETFLLHQGTNHSCVLNDIGSDIWSLIDGKRNLRDIEDELMELYEIARGVLNEQVYNFITSLEEQNFIELRSPQKRIVKKILRARK